jgi:hypothetical protein
MPNWWLMWAERIAAILAEWWLRSRPAGEADGPGAPSADRPTQHGEDPTPPPHGASPLR